jgi:pimeloyl-ACP methyl ester carboxylesterase
MATTITGLHAVESRPEGAPDAPTVVLVHGSLDRAQSFRRVIRRLDDVHVVAYDRRGYAGSRHAADGPCPGIDASVDDLLGLASTLPSPVVLVGHSYGGDVVVGAALREPSAVAGIGAYEPPMPWLGFRPQHARRGGWEIREDPAEEAEQFFRRMVGDSAWERLSESGRRELRADGPALVADMRSFRGEAPFDVTTLRVPALFGRGGPQSRPHHRETTAWLAANVPGARLFEVAGATHGAHLSHPDGFAEFVRAAIAAAPVAPGA